MSVTSRITNLYKIRRDQQARKFEPFSAGEKIFIKELIMKYCNIVENPKKDVFAHAQKKRIWIQMCREFNAVEHHRKRTVMQLRKCWENMKNRGHKELLEERRERKEAKRRQSSSPEPVDNEEPPTDSNDYILQRILEGSDDGTPEENITEENCKDNEPPDLCSETQKRLERLRHQIEQDKELHILKVKGQMLANKASEEQYLLATEQREWERQLFEMKKTLIELQYDKEMKGDSNGLTDE